MVENSGEVTTHMYQFVFFVISWGLLIDIGIIIAQHFKTYKHYQTFHGGVFFIVDGSTYYVAYKIMTENHFVSIPGVIFLLMTLLQHSLGGLTHIAFLTFKGRQDYIAKIQKFHKTQGYVLYVLGKLAILIWGVANDKQYDTGYLWTISSIIVVLLGVALQTISQIIHKRMTENPKPLQIVNNDLQYVKLENEENPQDQELVQMVSDGKSLKEIKKRFGEKIVFTILQNQVIKLTGYNHPGGNYIFRLVNGREVDRFFYGGYALEGDNRQAHKHSSIAEIFALNNSVGEIKIPDNQNVVFYPQKNQYKHNVQYWSIVEIKKYNEAAFFAKMNHQTNRIKNYMTGVEWLGKYYQVQLESHPKRRLYTVAICLNKDNTNYRQRLLKFEENGFTGSLEKMPELTKDLVLCIKKYQPYQKTLSSLISQSEGNKLIVQGPLGLGLHIPKNANGTFVLIAGGTGILPFLDLINLILQKAVYEIAKSKKGQQFADQSIDIHNIGLSEIFNQTRFELYGTFTQIDEFFGKEIIIPLQILCNKYKLPFFKSKIRLSKSVNIEGIDVTKQKFDFDFFKEQMKDINNLQRILICGPPILYKDVPEALKKMVNPEDIYYV